MVKSLNPSNFCDVSPKFDSRIKLFIRKLKVPTNGCHPGSNYAEVNPNVVKCKDYVNPSNLS